ncbi:MAG: cell division protein FtsH, partial [Verrucomicrobia bacterium]
MNRRQPSPKKRQFKPTPPKWNSPVWFLPLMLLMVWLWQSTIMQLAYRRIPYSEFKEHLARGEVVECAVKEDTIEGKLLPKPTPEGANAATNPPAGAKKAGPEKKETFFRTVRVEDPKLVEDLEAAGVRFHGERPSVLSQLLLAWVLPIGVLFLLWMLISRRIGAAG